MTNVRNTEYDSVSSSYLGNHRCNRVPEESGVRKEGALIRFLGLAYYWIVKTVNVSVNLSGHSALWKLR
jgi:hypothetical protein